MRRVSAVVVLALAVLHTNADARLEVEVLRSVGGLPYRRGLRRTAQLPATPGGPFYVFDRRGTAYAVDSDTKTLIKLVEIGPELGRILQPRGFDTSATGSFVAADAASGRRTDRFWRYAASGVEGSRFRSASEPPRSSLDRR